MRGLRPRRYDQGRTPAARRPGGADRAAAAAVQAPPFPLPGPQAADPSPRPDRHPVLLKTGIRWNDLPCARGCGSGSRCRRRLQEWPEAGVGPEWPALLLAERRGADQVDWSRAAVESSLIRARGGGEQTGSRPVDRRKKGSKHVGVVDGSGIPLAATVSVAHAPDVTQLEGVVDAIPDVQGKPGRPRRRPDELDGDRGVASEPHREQRRRRGIKPQRAWRKTEHGRGLGRVRGVVERFFSGLPRFGRLRVRTDKSEGRHDAFLTLACAEICLSFL